MTKRKNERCSSCPYPHITSISALMGGDCALYPRGRAITHSDKSSGVHACPWPQSTQSNSDSEKTLSAAEA